TGRDTVTADVVAPVVGVEQTSPNTLDVTSNEVGQIVIKDVAGVVIGTGIATVDGTVEITLDGTVVDSEEITVEVTDAAGNTGRDTVTADVVAPVVGVEQTSQNTLDVTCNEACQIVIKDAADVVIGTGTATVNGTVEITLDRPLVDGEEITVEVTDAAGNTGRDTVTADVVAPVVGVEQTSPNTLDETGSADVEKVIKVDPDGLS